MNATISFPALARAGYASRGVIYLMVGGMAALAAWDSGGRTTDGKGALTQLLGAPFGKLLLSLIAAGLLCYAGWRSVQALLDADGHGHSFKAMFIRAGLAISAVIHVSLAVFALNLITGWGSGGGDSKQEWTAWLLGQPFGQWIVGLVGVAIVGAGMAHFVKAWRAKFVHRFAMKPGERRVIVPVSRFGLAARGIVFVLVGCFFVVAALQQDASEATGLSGALDTIRQQPYGGFLLAVVALGLVAFGVYSIIEAVYRRIDLPPELRSLRGAA